MTEPTVEPKKEPPSEASAKKPAGKKAAASGKKKKKKKPEGPPLSARIGHKWEAFKEGFSELIKGLTSSDPKTRRMSFIFFVTCFFAIGILFYASHYYYAEWRLGKELEEKEKLAQTDENITKLVSRQKEAAHAHNVTLGLGVFTIELKPVAGAQPAPGVMNVAEVEIVVECDSKEASQFIENNAPQVRDQVASVFVSVDREELMSLTGKRTLKRKIIRKINQVLPKGQVKEIYFTKMVIS